MRMTSARHHHIWLTAGAALAVVTGLFVSPQAGAPAGFVGPAITTQRDAEARAIRVLFLGHASRHHPSSDYFPMLAAPLARKGIQLTYVMTPEEALDPATLARYDALMIYANHAKLAPGQERALLDFVEGGKALVALHAASAMFTHSQAYIDLVGGEFQRHGTGEFTAEIVQPDHPAVAGIEPFETWDETYVHTRHNTTDRTVLMERVDEEGREPWTWVRTQGKGRVFYTAYGHDERTWNHPSFQRLVEQGLLWAVNDEARQTWQRLRMPEVTYVDGFNVPNYEKRDPPPLYQMPFTPDESMRFINVAPEFSLDLVVSEPEVVNPITFNFDERGRLWVIEAIDYPNRVLRGQPGDDRIKVYEDTTGDGKADRVSVFAEHINLASSLVFANGGIIVAAQPHILFLKDTNGDGAADERRILSTGWGTYDSHAGPSNLHYGHDNYIWGTVGYAGFDGEINGERLKFGQGVFRFRPDGSDFEVVTGSTNNTWGLGFTETFDVLGSTANNDPSFHVAIPNRYFERAPALTAGVRLSSGPGYQSLAQFYALHPMTPYIRQVDVFGGYTAAAGHHLYTARAFPQHYWNRVAFISEPTAHLVGQGIVEPRGATFATKDGWNLLAGAEEWVAPVHAQVGPDGAVWVADWYNFIAQHNPTPPGFSNGPGNAYETSMRDRLRGRIYRVAYRDGTPSRTWELSVDRATDLLDALRSDNMLWRLHAQRLLVERGQRDVVPQLVALVHDRSVDTIGLNGGALHALWALHGLGVLTDTTSDAGRAAVDALSHPAAGVRKAAAMVLPRTTQAADAILTAKLLADPDLHTRLAVILTLADMPASPAVGRALYSASRDATSFGDRWLGRALHIAAASHGESFLTEYRRDRSAMQTSALPIALRLGAARPDWRQPAADVLEAEWEVTEAPGAWERAGLDGVDGVVWFTRRVTWPHDTPATTLTLGRVGNMPEVWVNGTAVSAPMGPLPSGQRFPTYEVPDGTWIRGENVVTVRITNTRGDGGFLGESADMRVASGTHDVSLAGSWHRRLERQTNAPSLYGQPGELAAHVAFATETAEGERTLTADELGVAPVPDVVLRLGVVPDELKFDMAELTVAPGQLVEITFSNTDTMPHNFLLGTPGSLERIGAAADEMMATPDGVAQQYVPQIAEVLFSSRLLNPGESATFQFRAPAQAGEYPYVCTFPGHWRLMNGVLQVRTPNGNTR